MASRASFVLAAALGLLAAAPVRAGLSSVREADGSQWQVIEDPADGAQGYVLERFGPDGRPDPHFGHDGRRAVAVSATNDAPTSLRVDAAGRVWLAGASIAADQPQAVVERLRPDGSLDIAWGVQGRVQLSPGGIAVKPNDILPLSDGSVLVAGVAANLDPTRAIVFHLKADGALDLDFGDRGTWQRAAVPEGSTATGLAVNGEGAVAVAVAARGEPGNAEIWSFGGRSPTLVEQQPLPGSDDGEDVRVAWSGRRWVFGAPGVPAARVEAAFLQPPATSAQGSPAGAASDPGQGGFSPFATEPPAHESVPAGDGLSWGWLGLALALAVAGASALAARRRAPGTLAKAGPRRQA